MLQKIINEYPKKSWLRLCTLNSINKWDLIDIVQEPIFPGKYHIGKTPSVKTRVCLQCQTPLNLGIYKNVFLVKKTCKCGDNGTNISTVEKLMCYYDKETSEQIIKNSNVLKKKGLPNTIDFWIHKGCTLEEAITQQKLTQKNRSMKSPSAQPGAKGYTNRFLNFWIKKGYSEEEAKIKLKESQTTNGLPYYIKKYGELSGTTKYNARIEKWLSSPNNIKMTKGRSKNSIELFEKIGFGFFGENEKTVRGKTKVHRVDYIFENKIIEFFGDYWHGNPKLFFEGQMIRKKKIEDVWKHDAEKIIDLQQNDYKILIIWENDYRKNPEKTLDTCKEFINEN